MIYEIYMRKTALFLIIMFIWIDVSGQTTSYSVTELCGRYHAVAGIAVSGPEGKDSILIGQDKPFPMQSVFKFHIALALLSKADEGKFSLDQDVVISRGDLLPETWSPIRDSLPDGGILSLADIIRFTVAQSDNNGCDILLRLLGGPKVVEDYFAGKGFSKVKIRASEADMHRDWNVQFTNTTTAREAIRVLDAFWYNRNNLLSQKSHDFIWAVMKSTTTGPNRIKAGLPEGTPLWHKTGSSGKNKEGITAALNDIGVFTLPDGKPVFIAVFVSESDETDETNEKIVAGISRIAWKYYSGD